MQIAKDTPYVRKIFTCLFAAALLGIVYIFVSGYIQHEAKRKATIPEAPVVQETAPKFRTVATPSRGSQTLYFPAGVSDVVDLKHGWYRFKLDGHWYLYKIGYRTESISHMPSIY